MSHDKLKDISVNVTNTVGGINITSRGINHIRLGGVKCKYAAFFFSAINNLVLENFECSSKFIISSDFIGKIEIGNISNSHIWIAGTRCNEILFYRSKVSNTIIKIQDNYMNKIQFDNVLNDGKIIFKNIRMINEIVNYYSGMSFDRGTVISLPRYHETKKPMLDISDSDLGKVNFISSDFSEVDFHIGDSNIIEINYLNFKFPNSIIPKTIDNINESLLGIFNQLKIISEKKKDAYTLIFQREELNYRYKVTHWIYEPNRKKVINPSEKFTLFMMKYSNDFRLDWVRGVIFTFSAGLLFYIPFVITSDTELTTKFSSLSNMMEGIVYFLSNYTGKYFEFLNPTHRVDFLGINDSDIKYFWDMLGRIFIGFGIYQTIQAFRKYGKDL